MKCRNCGASVQPRFYGKHVSKCIKARRDSTAPQCESAQGKPESKCYPIGGVSVKFPYKPYPVQFQYMSKVIQALKNNNHALLESPTGTGKTLSLLCSSLSWQQKIKAEVEAEEYRTCPVHDIDPSSCTEPDPDTHEMNGASAHENNRSATFVEQDDTDYRQGRKFGKIASIKINNPVTKKKNLEKNTRTIHLFLHDIYRNVKVKRVDVRSLQKENSLNLVEIDESTGKSIFVEIPKSGVAMVKRTLYLKPNTKFETWVLEQPDNYRPPKFIDETSPPTTPKKISTPQDDDDDFITPTRTSDQSSGIVENEFDKYDFEKADPVKSAKLENTSPSNGAAGKCSDCCCDEIRLTRRAPKIYFCTRTHRQIAQIIRELNKTEFNKVKMSILSSREHSCVNPKLKNESNKNEKCRELRQEKKCMYGENSKALCSASTLRKNGITQAWDVEELAEVGRKVTACPYYASVEMAKSADIVFGPYNYILDPFIASQRELDLSDNVVIFDEGHNIEDVCRSSVGYEATQFEMGDAILNLDEVIEKDQKCLAYCQEYGIGFESQVKQLQGIKQFLVNLQTWTLGFKCKLVDDYFEHSHYSLDGVSCLKQLQALGITSDLVEQLNGWLTIVADKDNEMSESPGMGEVEYKRPKPKSSTFYVCEKFIFTYRTFAATGNAPSFSLCIKQSPLSVQNPNTHKYERMIGMTLNITCLNPSVVFKHLSTKCHSVIVTSGTLSPMDTFQSELGTEFRVQHEGKHVVPKSNFMAMNLTAGPSGHSFNAGYKNAETFKFQDDVGDVIRRTCSLVPHGVLVFFPSYRLLEKVSERWQNTGMWQKMESHKVIVSEPRGSNRYAFNEAMDEFTANVESGALLLAVCRGKISEGVDFADDNARAVITIGLPFPNFKSTEITDKRKYNDKFCKDLGLLSGQDWYTIQAFRAVNQALGRCLRHIKDWGAIIMIESRLPGNDRYWKSISRWIRDEMISTDNCSEALERLEYFCHDKRGMLDQYDMNSGGFDNSSFVPDTSLCNSSTVISDSTFANLDSTNANLDSTNPNLNSTNANLDSSKMSHSKYPVIDLTISPEPAKVIPLFTNDQTLAEIRNEQSSSDVIPNITSTMKTEDNYKESDVDVARSEPPEISSSPELFSEGATRDTEECEKECVEEMMSPPKVIASSEDKRLHSPEETTNLVIKRRRVSRMQQMLNESSSEYHSSGSDISPNSCTPTTSTSCRTCSNRLLKTRPSPDNAVSISDFIRGRYDIRALGKLQFTAFPDENSLNSTLGNMAVFCTKCETAIGRITFSIEDSSVRGVVQLE